jgi:hypothetical protein
MPFHSRISSCPAHSGRSVANYEGHTGAPGGHRHSHQKCCLGTDHNRQKQPDLVKRSAPSQAAKKGL